MNVHLAFEPIVYILAQLFARNNSTVVISWARLEYFVKFKNDSACHFCRFSVGSEI